MFMKISLLFFLGGTCSGFWWGPDWNDLKVTWGPNPFNSNYYQDQPRTVDDAIDDGFTKISDCDENANWRGARYVKDGDRSLILLYDVNGFIAGIQTSLPKNQADGYPSEFIRPPFVDDGDYYVSSVYFVDPAIICKDGRSQDDFDREGTGEHLYIQNGTNAETDSVRVPLMEENIAGTKWTQGKCFRTMGVHYWYDQRGDMSCDAMMPVFILYNGGRLNAFGWAMNTALPQSPHYEHPGYDVLSLFIKDLPTCLADVPGFTSMHVFLTRFARLNFC